MSPAEQIEDLLQIRKMRVVSLVEGTTLLLLIGVAVPLKHLVGFSLATRLMDWLGQPLFVRDGQSMVATSHTRVCE